MAPEVIETNGNVTPKCDIWSLACTVIELCSGKPPFYEKNQFQAMLKIVEEQIPIPEEFSQVSFMAINEILGITRFFKEMIT